MTIWSIGHSTHSLERFVELLRVNEIQAVADVRRFPVSRRHPQFGAASLSLTLPQQGVEYHPFPDLGGRRDPKPDSMNTAWKDPAFRGYADYMEDAEFGAAISRLTTLAAERSVAIMCAEADWQRCHRSLICDHLKASGDEVLHILPTGEAAPHTFTKAARIINGHVCYTREGLFG